MAPAAAPIRHARNSELARLRDKQHALSDRPSAADRLLRFLLQLLVVSLWKSLRVLSVPLGRLFAVWLWLGKSAVTLSLFVERQLLKAIGYLGGTGFARGTRVGRLAHHYFGADVKRWHVGLGERSLVHEELGRAALSSRRVVG